ncbi:MAG: hypothetical protein V7724_20100, partial [Sediminicola sp.]
LRLTNPLTGGNEIDLSGYLDNTDSQDLSIVGDQLSIAGGNTVTVPTANGTETKVAAGPNVTVGGDGSSGSPYVIGVASLDDADADATNEIQDVSSADGSVTVTRTLDDFDLSVTFPANNDNSETNELTDLALSSDILRLTNPLTGGNEIDLSGYIDNTDAQNLTGASLGAGNILQIDIENGSSATVDLSSLANTGTDDQTLGLASNTLSIEGGNGVDLSGYLDNTDDQNISTDGTSGNLSIEGGNTIALNVDDADSDPSNEVNTSSGMNNGSLEITDSAGTLSTRLISTDANNNLSAGNDGALYLNVASVAIAETNTNLSDNGDGSFTYVNENGVTQIVNKSDITDNGNGTYTFTNNDSSDVVLDTRASANPYDNSASGLLATVVQDAIDELAAGSTDDQTLDLVSNTLSIEGGNGVDLSGYLDNTDDQNISTDGTSGNLSIEGGNAIALNVDDADSDPSNEYNTGISFDGANLTVTDAGGAQIVDISGVDTDGQDLTGASLGAGNILQIDIENGSSATVDLSSLANTGTDDQTLDLVSNTLSIEGGNGVDLSGYLDNTDDQNIITDGTSGNLSIE